MKRREMIEKIKNITKTAVANTGAAAVPATYIHTFDSLEWAMRAGGFLVILLQGFYLAAKIRNEWRKKDVCET